MAILIPEVEIYRTLNAIFDFIRKNYQDNVDEKKTILYYIFGERNGEPLVLENMNWFKQAKKVIIGSEEDKDIVQFRMGYNLERMGSPTIHIMLPSESPVNGSLGNNEGYEKFIVDEQKNESVPVLTASSECTYNLLITSDNYNSMIILYQFIKAIFLSLETQLELKGFQNVRYGGSDINFDDSIVPTHIYHRNFNLLFTYDYSSLNLFPSKFGKEFVIGE